MFSVWLDDLLRPLAAVPITQTVVVAMVRVSGTRSLAELNAFDMVVVTPAADRLRARPPNYDAPYNEGIRHRRPVAPPDPRKMP